MARERAGRQTELEVAPVNNDNNMAVVAPSMTFMLATADASRRYVGGWWPRSQGPAAELPVRSEAPSVRPGSVTGLAIVGAAWNAEEGCRAQRS